MDFEYLFSLIVKICLCVEMFSYCYLFFAVFKECVLDDQVRYYCSPTVKTY